MSWGPPRVHHPVMYQSWCSLTFLHWPYPVDALRKLVPTPLEIETFDGSAWVGITPFVLRGLRPPFFPALPWISIFPETNCRTYVKAPDGSSGVWFFSLDSARAPAVAGARLAFGLPYAWSRMRVTQMGSNFSYQSSRIWPDSSATTDLNVEAGSPIDAQELENFLTARFRLYSFRRGGLRYADVEHPPWPLQAARVISAVQTLTNAAGLSDPTGPPIAHFSAGVNVRIGTPRRVSANGSGRAP